MEKTVASLLLTLVISVLGIPAAYLLGQRSADYQYREELARLREERRILLASLRPETQIAPINSVPEAPPAAEDVPVVDGVPDVPQPVEEAPRESMARADVPALETAAAPPEPVIEVDSGPPIPQAVFEAAAIGASYDQVVREFGREGKPMMTLEDGNGTVTTQYVWEWSDTDGSSNWIRMRFVDGWLVDKTVSD